jgi:hypothetical protein
MGSGAALLGALPPLAKFAAALALLAVVPWLHRRLLLEQDMLRAVLVMLVVSSIIGLLLTQRFATRLVRGA